MEEVWNDINLASLHDPPTIREDPNRDTHFRALTFQDFLGRPVNKNPPSRISGGYSSPASPPATTALNLNSLPDQLGLLSSNDSDPLRSNYVLQPQPISSSSSSLNVLFDALASSSGLPALGKKRFPESESSSGDRRHKRMIKNRESAARSRARKQAYTIELEQEVAHLMEENARLKRQQQQLIVAAEAQVPKKHTLYRTSTAPF